MEVNLSYLVYLLCTCTLYETERSLDFPAAPFRKIRYSTQLQDPTGSGRDFQGWHRSLGEDAGQHLLPILENIWTHWPWSEALGKLHGELGTKWSEELEGREKWEPMRARGWTSWPRNAWVCVIDEKWEEIQYENQDTTLIRRGKCQETK